MFKKLQLSLLLAISMSAGTSFGMYYDGFNLDLYANYKKIIQDMYAKIDDARIPEEDRVKISTMGGGSPVYGEILFESNLVLIDYCVRLLKELDKPFKKFMDCGSGLGKTVNQWALMTDVALAFGVEWATPRWEKAHSTEKQTVKIYNSTVKFENEMRKTFEKEALPKVKGKKVEFVNASFFDVSYANATILYTCSTCFNDECMKDMVAKYADECEDGTIFMTLRQFPPHENVYLKKVFYLPMTWSPNTPVYLYILDREKSHEKEEDYAPFATMGEEDEFASFKPKAVATEAAEEAAEVEA